MALSTWASDQIINHLFRTGTMSKPTTVAVALLTTSPADSDSGQFTLGTGVEVSNSGTAYARVNLGAPSDSDWDDPSGTQATENSSTITFPTASGSWGTVVAVALVDSATYDSGNMIAWATLTTSKTVGTGDTISFAVGDCDFTLV